MFNILLNNIILDMSTSANIIAFIHLLFIIFIVTTPFVTDNPLILLYYCFILFFVMFHWYLNDDTCVLTIIESKLRGKKDTETFMGKLIKPIYNITSNEIHYFALFLLVYTFIKTRIWEKEKYELVYTTLYVKYKLICNKFTSIKYDNNFDENIKNARKYYIDEITNFLVNPYNE